MYTYSSIQNSVSHIMCTQLHTHKMAHGRKGDQEDGGDRRGKNEYSIRCLDLQIFFFLKFGI